MLVFDLGGFILKKKTAAEGWGVETRFIATALAVSKWRGTHAKTR